MAATTTSRAARIGLWVFKAILALMFAAFGAFKLMGMPMLVREFDIIGLGQGFRYLTGVIEIGGAVGLLIPAASRYAAIALLGVSVGAFVAQATRLHGDVIHTLVLIAATGFLAWISWRPSLATRAATA